MFAGRRTGASRKRSARACKQGTSLALCWLSWTGPPGQPPPRAPPVLPRDRARLAARCHHRAQTAPSCCSPVQPPPPLHTFVRKRGNELRRASGPLPGRLMVGPRADRPLNTASSPFTHSHATKSSRGTALGALAALLLDPMAAGTRAQVLCDARNEAGVSLLPNPAHAPG